MKWIIRFVLSCIWFTGLYFARHLSYYEHSALMGLMLAILTIGWMCTVFCPCLFDLHKWMVPEKPKQRTDEEK